MSIFDWPEEEYLDEEATLVRARRAAQLLADPTLQEALADVERTFLSDWYNSTDTQTREAAHAKVHALAEVRRRLQSFAEDAVVMGQRL